MLLTDQDTHHVHIHSSTQCLWAVHTHLCISRYDSLGERHSLFLTADHSFDVLLLCKRQLGYSLETLLEVGLNSKGVLCLGEDLKKFVV